MSLNDKVKIINAGAGSGKTFTISKHLLAHINLGGSVNEVIITTFTKKGARELRERIKQDLIATGKTEEAQKVDNAWIGTIHSLGKRLIDIFTFEAGYAPDQQVIPEEDEDMLFGYAMAQCLKPEDYREFNNLAEGLKIINWQDDVLKLIKKARENDIDLTRHEILADHSIQIFNQITGGLAKNPVSYAKVIVLKEIANIIRIVSSANMNTAKPKRCVEAATNIINKKEFDNEEISELYDMTQALDSRQEEISKIYNAAKEVSEDLNLYLELEELPENFNEKYKILIKKLFLTASLVYDQYSNFKKERGLLDYSDQENEFLHLLSKDSVKEYIKDQFRLLMVDEFQDTNPMQLAIFMRLAAVVEKTLLVGDLKQSIYSFRDTDPSLIKNVYKNVGLEDRLDISRRSREPLVYFGNHIFTSTFERTMSKEDIELKPWDELTEDQSFDVAIRIWNTTEAKNADIRRRTITAKIRDFIEKEKPVFRKKDSKELMNVGYGDMAILCRSNAEIIAWAEELERIGIEVSADRTGYHSQAEVVFLIAAANYLVDRYNTLAIAELLVLTDPDFSGDPGKIIDNRLDYNKNKTGKWMSDQEIIKKLDSFRKRSEIIGISETIQELIVILDLYGLTARWTNASVRRSNIQQLINLALKYEQRCVSYSNAISLQGFIHWIKSDPDLKQVGTASKNAVKVMTYHGAKGLEWPVVILDGLQQTPHDVWWGVYAITPEDKFNIANPLQDRELLFIYNPFGFSWRYPQGESYNQPCMKIKEQISKSVFYLIKKTKEDEEAAILLYVGITRARDYLILPTPSKSRSSETGWWEAVTGENLAGFFDNSNDFSISTYETLLTVKVNTLDIVDEEQVPTLIREKYYADTCGEKVFDPLIITPSSLTIDESDTSDNVRVNKYAQISGDRLCSGLEEKDLGDALHNVLYVWNNVTEQAKRLIVIGNILKGFGLDELSPEAVDKQAGLFFNWVNITYPGCSLYKELPIKHVKGNQIYQGFADLLIETQDSLVLVDYKSYQGVDFLDHAKKYHGQLSTYGEMIETAHPEGKKIQDTLIYYPVTGVIVKLDFLQ